MKINNISAFILLFVTVISYGQVGIGTANPHRSAILDITSSNKGFLMPRLNLTGRNDAATILNPANGLLVVNLTANGTGTNAVAANSIYYWQNSIWQKFTALYSLMKY